MIELSYYPSGIYVYNVEGYIKDPPHEAMFTFGEIAKFCINFWFLDWVTLRREHRIIGEIIGSNNNIPSLPLKLLPEEVALLLDKNLVKVVAKTYPQNDHDKYHQFENDLFEQQQILYKKNRKRQLETMIDKIVAAKRKMGNNETAEEIFDKELEKSSKILKENMIWPILLTPLSSANNSCKEIDKNVIYSKTNSLKVAVYKNLWERGYYITQGHKFGGDFLVYLGDPIIYHAIFIVRCVENANKEINTTEIIGFGRLGTCVKKRAVLASLNDDNTVSYITINWMEA